MRVLVTGASGFVGSAVVTDLREGGHTVVGTARSERSADRIAALGAGVVRASLDDTDLLHEAAAAVDAVIHLAFRHADPTDEAVATDRRIIEVLGDALAGTGRPLVVTSGTLVLRPGWVGVESDSADAAAPAAERGRNEGPALALADRGVRVSVIRLAPSVHDTVKRGFVGALIDIVARARVGGYIDAGSPRWPTVHRRDAARLFRRAVESAEAGTVLHGVAESGVPLRAVAEAIGAGLGVPTRPVSADKTSEYFGWLAPLVSVDASATSGATQQLLGWQPSHRGLLDDLAHGLFFAPAESSDASLIPGPQSNVRRAG